MEPKIFSLTVTIALLYYTKMVLSQTNMDNPVSRVELFLETINPSSRIVRTDDSGIEALVSPESQVTFRLYTRSNPDSDYSLIVGDINNLTKSPFSSKRQTKFIIHGWAASSTESWVIDMRKNYLATADYNVIAVDWFPLSASEYTIAARLTRLVGDYTGDLLNFLNAQAHMSFGSVHIMGHSLGAHCAGFAGAKATGKIKRITGMDAARPLFEWPEFKDPQDRLDRDDASFVDIIHTCAGTAGFTRAIGHIDFYPNGGSYTQPGCSLIESQTCSHGRAHDLMADSIIYPKEFVARQCDSWENYNRGACSDNTRAIMGEHVNQDSRGIFYLATNSKSPYGKA